MARKGSLSTLQKSFLKRVDALLRDNASFRDLLLTVKAKGDNSVAQKARLESKMYDEQWVDKLEKGFESLDRIVANPHSFIKEKDEVVIAALAKRVTSASVIHLASHSQFIHSMDKDGRIVPEKILSARMEEDLAIYENRFIMTLIQKLAVFIEKRYRYIASHEETRNSDVLLVHSQTELDGVRYEIDDRIKLSVPSPDNGNKEKNAELLAKITRLRERVYYYLHSSFMKSMEGAKPVHNPLAMTNLMMKNPDYHAAYELWCFIDNYRKLGITYSVKEVSQSFDDRYFDEIYALILANLLTLHSHEIPTSKLSAPQTRKKELAPKVLLSLDDETFSNTRFLSEEPHQETEAKAAESTLSSRKKEKATEKVNEKARLEKAKKIHEEAEESRTKVDRMEAEAAAIRHRKEAHLLAKAIEKKKAEQKKEQELAQKKALEAQREAILQAKKAEAEALKKARDEVIMMAKDDRQKEEKMLKSENTIAKQESKDEVKS